MAARRRSSRRRRGRSGVLYKLLSVLLILAAIVTGSIVFFRVEEITVTGGSAYTEQQIVDASGVELGDNLILVQRVPTGRKILSELPYIKDVNIRRALPNSLRITVNECIPVTAMEGEEGAWWIMDSSTKLLEQGNEELAGQYMKITGLTPLRPSAGGRLAVSVEESPKLDSMKEILSAMEERGLFGRVERMDLSAVSEIRLELDGYYTVRMPMYSDDFHRLIHTLQVMTENAAVAGRKGTIDLTGERPRFIPDQASF